MSKFVSKYGNTRAEGELVARIVSEVFHNPDSEFYMGDPSIEPDMEDQDFDPAIYGDMTEYDREGARYATGAYVTPEWVISQNWYKEMWAAATGYVYEDSDDLDNVDIPESDWHLVPMPNLVIQVADYGNCGDNRLFTVEGGSVITPYTPDSIEYGGSGPAYSGNYSSGSTIEITEWCDGILENLDESYSIWL